MHILYNIIQAQEYSPMECHDMRACVEIPHEKQQVDPYHSEVSAGKYDQTEDDQ